MSTSAAASVTKARVTPEIRAGQILVRAGYTVSQVDVLITRHSMLGVTIHNLATLKTAAISDEDRARMKKVFVGSISLYLFSNPPSSWKNDLTPLKATAEITAMFFDDVV